MKAALEDQLAGFKQIPGAAVLISTLTIATGSVTPTSGQGHYRIDTEAAASTDDLTNIVQTNLPDGSALLIRSVASARTVVLKHAAGGAGQLSIGDAADLSLVDPTMWVLFVRNGTQWDEVSRAWGSKKVEFRARYDLPNLTVGANTFTKTQEWAKGADVASAAALALGTDGNYFVVTGTTTITSIGAKTVGARALLQFAGVLTLTHHATNLILQNATNLVTAAGDVLELVSVGSGQWRETNRHLTVATPSFYGSPDDFEFLIEEWNAIISVPSTTHFCGSGARWQTITGLLPLVLSGSRTSARARGDDSSDSRACLSNGSDNPAKITQASRNPHFYANWAQFGAAAVTRFIGLGDSANGLSAAPVNGIYFRAANAGNIIGVCRSASVESTLDTTVAAANGTYRRCHFEVKGGGASVEFFVDGVSRGTISANIPSAALSIEWGASSIATTDGLDIDSLVLRQTR